MQVETTRCENIKKNPRVNVSVKTKLDKCVESIVKSKGYITFNVKKMKITADGGNLLGRLYEIDIKGKTDKGYKETAIFCKNISSDPVDMGFLSLQDIYKNELFAYKGISKIMNELQDEVNIPVDERYNMVKCYDESYEQTIFMENLSRKGYKTWFRMDIVTLDMAEACINQIAKFHGISFALEQLKPKYFDNYIKNIKTPLKFNKEWSFFTNKFFTIGMDNLDNKTRNKVEDKLRSIVNKYPGYINDQSTQYCLCHGDYKPNNVLIKEKDGKVLDAVPVDFQLMHYGCPVFDFFYFIYMSTDYDFRKAHMNHLKNHYYNSLEHYLRYFNVSVESVFPRKVFEDLYEEKRDFGIIVTFIFSILLFVAEDKEVPDVTEEDYRDIEFKFDDKLKVRIKGVIQEYIDMKIL